MRAGDPAEQEVEASRPTEGTDGRLEPFPGRFIPGLCFESGHCFWLLAFSETPTDIGAYTEFWVVTPEGERVLYVDPADAVAEVLTYHDFDRTEGAAVTVTQPDPGSVEIECEGEDGTTVSIAADLDGTLGTGILNGAIALTPDAVLTSPVGTTVSTGLLNMVLDAKGLKTAGRTETGRRYRLDVDELSAIPSATATIDGDDLGAIAPPGRPVEFGDAKTTGEPIFAPGVLHLERME